MKRSQTRFARTFCLAVCLVLGLDLGLGAGSAFGADAIPKALQQLHTAGFEIGKHFDAGHGLVGWVITRSGQSNIVYTTRDGEAIITGMLVDAQGHNLSESFARQYISHPDLKPVYEELSKSAYIAEGKGDGAAPTHVVYVIFDPNCPYCSIAWKALRQHVGNGVELRWVPVAYLQSTSLSKAAAILAAKDQVAALGTNEAGFNPSTHQGGIAPATDVPEAVTAALKHNEDLMGRLGSTATPTFVWTDAHNEIQSEVGLPAPAKMLEIVGMGVPAPAKATQGQ